MVDLHDSCFRCPCPKERLLTVLIRALLAVNTTIQCPIPLAPPIPMMLIVWEVNSNVNSNVLDVLAVFGCSQILSKAYSQMLGIGLSQVLNTNQNNLLLSDAL